jgi:hypothetical protein
MNAPPQRLRFRRFSTVQLLIALGLFFIWAPFVEEIEGGQLIVSGLFSLVLLAGIVAVADRKSVMVIAIVLAIPAIGGRWISHFRPDLIPPAVFLVAGLILIAFVVGNLLRFVLRAPSVNTEVLCASISAYLMLGLMWTLAYWLVDRLTPGGAFSFNTNGAAIDRRVQWLLLQLHHTKHRRLRRHHSRLKNGALARGNGSDDRSALCGGTDRSPGLTLFDSEI